MQTYSGNIEKDKAIVPLKVQELHENSDKWAVIYFSESAITRDKNHQNDARPEFITNQHQFIPNIGIGYANANRKY